MKIASLQKTSLIEYPDKLSCIIFTQGCNFRCPYCHNPELVLPEKFLPLIPSKEIFDFLKKRKNYLQGIVITGGEPCIQKGLINFLNEVKQLGYYCKLDTNGTIPEALSFLIEEKLVDYISMDIKAPLAKYPILTGVNTDTKKIKESIGILQGSGIDYEFKTTVVFPLLQKEDFIQIGKLVENAKIHFLQRFVPNVVLDKKCLYYPKVKEKELEEIKEIMLKYVKVCRIR